MCVCVCVCVCVRERERERERDVDGKGDKPGRASFSLFLLLQSALVENDICLGKTDSEKRRGVVAIIIILHSSDISTRVQSANARRD